MTVSLRLILDFYRPVTLIAPATGIVFGGLTALLARPEFEHHATGTAGLSLVLGFGAVAAALLNGASNTLNQISDRVEDRINKPDRPLVSGRTSVNTAATICAFSYALSLVMASLVNQTCVVIDAAGAACTVLYSLPPISLENRGLLANFTIAMARGMLLWLAGWVTVKPLSGVEPFYLGTIWFLFIFGASATKDFADVEGDRRAGNDTLPVRFGARVTARFVSPFFVLPFLLIPVGAHLGILTAKPMVLNILSAVLVLWGSAIAAMILRDPDSLSARGENHPGWRWMYGLMVFLQIGLFLAYLLSSPQRGQWS